MPLSLFSFSLISMFFTIYLVLAQRSSIISMHFARTDPRWAQRGPGPSLGPKKKNFFWLVKFSENPKKKGLGPPLVFSSGPLPKIMNPPPAHHPASPGAHDPGKSIKKKKTQLSVVNSPTPNEESKKNKEKKKKKRKGKGEWEARQRIERQDREWERPTHPRRRRRHPRPRRVAVSPWRHEASKPILILLVASPSWSHWWDPRETHLPSPPPVARSAQPSFVALAFTVHRYLLLSFPSKPNKMFVTLWSEIHRK